jgi:transposase InsO family protein
MWKELLARGVRVGKERVRKLMALHGIRARHKRKYIATTNSNHDLPVAPNLLQRDFSPAAPNQVWTSDITYVATAEGWLYLVVIIDLFSRQVVGWSMQPHMKAELVTDALRMAWFRRRPEAGVIVHTDRGSQYCSHLFQDALKAYGMRSSMSRRGDCWDNAPTESLWGSLKVARLHGRQFATRRAAMDEVIDWLGFYNASRLHSTLGYVSPMTFEKTGPQLSNTGLPNSLGYGIRGTGARSRDRQLPLTATSPDLDAEAATGVCPMIAGRRRCRLRSIQPTCGRSASWRWLAQRPCVTLSLPRLSAFVFGSPGARTAIAFQRDEYRRGLAFVAAAG